MSSLDNNDVDLIDDPFEPTPLPSSSVASDPKVELLRRENRVSFSGSTLAIEDIRSKAAPSSIPSSSMRAADQVSADGSVPSFHAPHLTCKRSGDDTTDGLGCLVDLQFNHHTDI